ncbi:1-acyl-sn-glycerol-3-phosphate acyltransferase [Auraticoccus sp. F435]|uniref:1-acyl-sn-glycerol-3-phosphate acyltransferase n=2 Tax=Auraticoccus cholistanensis TaxID=2656650 RepID=A0A6A9URV6_9ACTN|nr:1-acyl-sn-glycerol-3-phosphate acyltransferase [Auraticoccus cholistanensis]
MHLSVSLLGWVMRRLTRQDWRHPERVPSHGGAVVVVNHISNADFLSYGHFLAWGAGRWPRFMAKASLFDAPLLGRLLRSTGQIRVDRGSDRAGAAVHAATEAVRRGQLVTVYPEGTITADPDGWPMTVRTGAARIALAAGCPVVPVAQWGVQELLPGKRATYPRLWRRPVSRVVAGQPVQLDDLRAGPADEAAVREASRRIADALTGLLAELRQQVPPAGRWDLAAGRRLPVDPPADPPSGPLTEDRR